MKKHLLIAAGVVAVIAGLSLSPGSAQASWAETAQGNPVYTGTNQSLWRSEHAQRRFSYGSSRRHWNAGYSSYGAYNGGGYMGGGYLGGGYMGGYYGY